MKALNDILQIAARSERRIVLSDGADPRILQAALMARARRLARILLVGPEAQIRAGLAAAGGGAGDGIDIHDPLRSPLLAPLSAQLHALRRHRGMSVDEARHEAQLPRNFAALLVRTGHADGTLGGATVPTADIVRAAIRIIGTAPGCKLVSSYFLMMFCQAHHGKPGAYLFSDAGLVVDPTAAELAEIAVSSAASYTRLTGGVPRVAMLSFSTQGSASHACTAKVSQATELARRRAPGLVIDGEIQFDAAFVPSVAQAKAPSSPLAGDANVFVFPNLDAGNIGYKIAQRLGGAEAIGPILQGLARPANDLSRGCTAEDVLHMIAVTASQALSPDQEALNEPA